MVRLIAGTTENDKIMGQKPAAAILPPPREANPLGCGAAAACRRRQGEIRENVSVS
jgi:hypothetical protein